MKNCEYNKEHLSAFVDDELTTSERKELLEHLESCSSCRAKLNSLKEISAGVSSMEKMSMPDKLEKAILSKTTGNVKKKPFVIEFFTGSYQIPRPVTWAAAILLIALGLNFFEGKPDVSPRVEIIQSPMGTVTAVQKVVFSEDDIILKKDTSKTEGSL